MIVRDTVRYDYKHSILERGTVNGRGVQGGQRISIMIRVRLNSIAFYFSLTSSDSESKSDSGLVMSPTKYRIRRYKQT